MRAAPSTDRLQNRREERGPQFHGPGQHLIKKGQKVKDLKGTLKRLVSYIKPYLFTLFIVLLLTIASNIFAILSPKILGNATTLLFNGEMAILRKEPGAAIDFAGLLKILELLTLLYALSSLFSYFQQYIVGIVAQRIVYDLRKQVFAKLNRLALKYYDSNSHGDILSRVTNDVDNIATTFQQALSQLLGAFVTVVGVTIMMFTINTWLALVTLVVLPLSFAVTGMVASRSQGYFVAQQKSLGELNGHVEEMLGGHKVVKAFGHEKRSITKFNGINKDLFDAGWKANFVTGLLMPMLGFANNIGYIIVCIIGGILVTRGAITVGDVQAFLQYSRQFSQPINMAAGTINIIQSAAASAERVFEMLDEPEQLPDPANPVKLEHPHGELTFEDVDFSYSPETELIRDMDLVAKPGQTIAIVGPTGAGKTTLVNLMLRFYEIDGGTIRIDGADIREMKRGDLRTLFGMVLQDSWLFKGTIRENIAYGAENPTEEEILRAANAARVDHFIRTLPDGYDTMLNEEASNISQGQRQLLTIARALLSNPHILILDEATSSVDTRTEVLIQNVMTELMNDRTSFVIAHRLSTIRNADKILVMNEGKIIETGTHTELLEQKGFYAELYNSQFTSSRA